MIAATQSNHPLASITSQRAPVSPLEEARNRIRDAGMRITKPRMAIIESLIRHEGPVSIDKIHRDVGDGVCDLVTVYRCLSAFENLGLVRRSYLHNGTCLYELTLGSPRHYHIVCKACGKTDRVDYFPVESMERMLQERGYAQVTHIVEFFGVCPDCQKVAAAHPRATVANPAIDSRGVAAGIEVPQPEL